MRKLNISRRAFNQTFAGLSAGAFAQLSGLFGDVFAWGQEARKLRLVCLTSPHGKSVLWNPRAPGGAYGSAAETGWTLDFPNSSLSPLEPHKDSLVIIEGLDHTCLTRPSSNNNAFGHHGDRAALTGTNIISNEDRRPTGPSIDVAVARHLGVEPFVFYQGEQVGSWGVTGQRVPDVGAALQYDPVNGAYRRLFANLQTPGTMPDPRLERANALEAATIKYLRDDAVRLRRRLAGSERVKLDLHLEALNAMERKLMPPVTTGCTKPAAPASTRDYLLDDATKHDLIARFIAASFACDLSRVATFHLGMNSSYPGVPGHAHNDVTHGAPYADASNGNTILHSQIHRWDATQVANLIAQLKAIPEGGGTVYDNTIILWTNELGNAQHHHGWNLPIVVAGGGASWVKGRYLKLRDVTFAADGRNSMGTLAQAHNHLLVSIINQFGMPAQTFGDPDISGPLTALG